MYGTELSATRPVIVSQLLVLSQITPYNEWIGKQLLILSQIIPCNEWTEQDQLTRALLGSFIVQVICDRTSNCSNRTGLVADNSDEDKIIFWQIYGLFSRFEQLLHYRVWCLCSHPVTVFKPCMHFVNIIKMNMWGFDEEEINFDRIWH